MTTDVSFGGSFAGGGLAILDFLVWVMLGPVIGLIAGMLNGTVIGLLSMTPLFRSAGGMSRSRVSATAAVTTGLLGFAALHRMFGSAPMLVYAAAAAGMLLAGYAAGKLPPVPEADVR